ncbi:MAG: 3-dehydroquinate synthase [Candidatus Loosdrechtia sp.]|uniref:3-dehydroquinate synthase family protein n=1 Tax=Candidatus Loosdrechtia sp. TaxID=3101272 RepID=UPI003A6C9D55|nr:MAG: 3-dehydroquinate synthase [Candidatus Jettenia sp. AMX2]
MEIIHVDLAINGYNIFINESFLENIGNILVDKVGPCRTLIITDENVGKIYGHVVSEGLEKNGFCVSDLLIKPGEDQKNLATMSVIYEACFEHKLDRNSLIVTLGGGVVGDIGGFAAATFMRGIRFVQVPTSLLAQVDSSIGGKVAVNHPRGKNMIGSFYQPRAVFIDINTLSTLPYAELVAGLVEVIKYGVIRDNELFEYLERNINDVLKLDRNALLKIIAASCSIKASIVGEDEKEKHVRAILNYGHTIGHAIEAFTNYEKYRHGEAVAIGMLYASKIAFEMELTNNTVFERQYALFKRMGLPLQKEFRSEDIIELLYLDKKTVGGRLRFILPKKIGHVVISDDVTEDILLRVLKESF